MQQRIFIGVAWPYVNGDIHIGHLAGYLLPADIFARFHRAKGNEVLMVSGSDCFGTPITLEAEKRGVPPGEIVAEYHAKDVALFRDLEISFDRYTKTDTANHIAVSQDIFLTLLKKGYIFKGTSEQYYSPDTERFLPDRYVEGTCLRCGYLDARSDQCDQCGSVLEPETLGNPRSKTSGKSVILKPTEHYFLDWSKLSDFLTEYVQAKAGGWREWVKNETEGWLREGLKPRPITRDIEWGVPVPHEQIPESQKLNGAEHKRIYVWFEAVIGYLSASREWAEGTERWKEFWYGDVTHYYFMGKDNLVFHTLFWPGELYAYDEGLHLPDVPVINQFLTLEGKKFSKSRGITIDSRYLVETYGLDPVRFYLCSIMPEQTDTNFSWEDFVKKHNDLLIGTFGNFINRTLTLGKGIVFSNGEKIDASVEAEVAERIGDARTALEQCEFKRYVTVLLSLADFGNKYVSAKEPWFIKDRTEFASVVENALFIVLGLFLVSQPLLPATCKRLSELLGVPVPPWRIPEIHILRALLPHLWIQTSEPLFQKIDAGIIDSERAKLDGR